MTSTIAFIEDTFNIENPTLSLDSENVTCFGDDDGQITYAIDFSTDIYTLVTPSSTNNLAPGTYEFLVQNNQGCFSIQQIIITEPDLVVVRESVEIICESTDLLILS